MEININLKAPINKFWKDYLDKYTSYSDVGKVSEETGVGFFTLKRLRLGEINVSNEKNKKAIESLVQTAIKNAGELKVQTKSDETMMKKNLSKVFDCI